MSPRKFFFVVLALVAVVFGVYAPSLHYSFIMDDHRFTLDPRVQTSGHLWEYFTNYVWSQFAGGSPSFYRPLFVLWMRTNFILCEMSPWGWHLLSILKHLAVALLLGLLVWKLLRDRIAALLAATLFALHPVHTECVAWVTVPDPLMSIGILGTLLLYLRSTEELSATSGGRSKKLKQKSHQVTGSTRIPRRALPWFVGAVVVCFMTLLAKETAIILPLIVFSLTLLMLRGEAQTGTAKNGDASFVTRLLAALRLTLPFTCVTALYFLLRFHAFGGRLGSLTQHLPWRTVILSWPAALWFYVKVLFWPLRSYAFADPTLAETFSLRGVLVPGLAVGCLVVGLAVTLYWAWRKARRDLPAKQAVGVEYALLIGTLLLVLPILLTLNLNVLNPGDFLHGRYVYLSCVGMMLILATAWFLAGESRMPLLSVACLLTVVCAVLTVSQEKQWKDDLTIFTVAHELAPNNPWVALNLERVHVQQAIGLVQQGRCSEVLDVFERVTREYPQDWFAWGGLGYCFFTLHNLPKAEEALHRAAQLSKDAHTIEVWQEVRAQMGLPARVPLD